MGWRKVRRWGRVKGVWLTAMLGTGVSAEIIPIPNGSFESPATPFVTTLLDAWQKSPRPPGYDEGGGFLWTQLTGAFRNTPATSPDHIDNCDGDQAVYLFALPEVALFQDARGAGGLGARFEEGRAYEMTVGVIGAGGNMVEGGTLELSLYFLDELDRRIPVATTTVTNRLEQFAQRTHFYDYQVRVPTVRAGQAWAGKPLGVQFLSTISPELEGGYWDLDNVRLMATGAVVPAGFQVNVRAEGADLRIEWPSLAGFKYQVAVTADFVHWSDVATEIAGTGGGVSVLVPLEGRPTGFYRVSGTAASP